MMLSKWFSLAEMTRSDIARINHLNNHPSDAVLLNMRNFCNHFADKVRDLFGIPITPSSGYRSFEVNRIAGGSTNSSHVEGEAMDFAVPGYTPKQVIGNIIRAGIDFDQLIDEFGKWVHGSFTMRKKNRMQVLKAVLVDGKKRYIAITLKTAEKW